MWPLHDRQRAHTAQKSRDLCLVYLVHQVRAGESFDGNMTRQVPASATAAGGWVACNKGGGFPARRLSGGGGWEGPHVCSAPTGLCSPMVTTAKVQASKMPWDPHARAQSLVCNSD